MNELKKLIRGNGFGVSDVGSLGLVDNLEIGKQTLDVAYNIARRLRHRKADVISISCTNFRTIEIIERLEKELGKPAISSNTATLWPIMKKMKWTNKIDVFWKTPQLLDLTRRRASDEHWRRSACPI